MPVTTISTNTRPAMRRAPGEPAPLSGPFGGRRSRMYGAIAGDGGETDFYLLRTYALVERVRRAVEARDEIGLL